ncbi:hypothetical protein [Motiliproteus sp. MSK22-1]|uniref:hypothetical protein n=1 Tax=Motiliproteus sp. MSK22-1 TaxID=1897630 RepID=UPI000977DA30|nr:hypothetical protein [Motiliproteus sp. MSK22-1]OMH31669.1 hypothetical protein BGP75_16210 [Motiliproteus sp. MSK22-1]
MNLAKIVGSSIALAICIIWSYSVYYFWEPSGFNQNSLAYFLKVDNEVKSFPILGAIKEPLYKVGAADGLKRTAVIVDYPTKYSEKHLTQELEFIDFICRFPPQEAYFICEKTDKQKRVISAIFSKKKGTDNLKANITFIGF